MYNERLKKLIEEKKLSIPQLAKLIQKSPNTIKSWLANPDSTKFRSLSYHMFMYIVSVVTLHNCKNDRDIEYLIADHNYSAEYHIKNAMGFLDALLNKLNNYNNDIASHIIKNLECALDDITITNQIIREYLPSIRSNQPSLVIHKETNEYIIERNVEREMGK
ncbi:helix-turn-helix transcriptional regulator [Legionella drozanskii]|uniref:Helix-turn-helix domain protein n=1 Tax=Legionella drozanskii LLAP-1 TaxID=1212489 RepID=A0A0W0T0I8_9GAMM|nr:helix-turn-helix transcriptional regulator [Legionella drozanskii]KTC89122.1 Helix-turn-helix domain protein [Legionella drozanskii LLAP-1]